MQQNRFSILGTMSILWLLLIFAVSALLATIKSGTQYFEIFSTAIAHVDIDLALRFDALSTLMFLMVSLLGVAIGHYAIRYLDGESRQGYFYKYLLSIILSVSLLVLSSNLIMFFAMWILTSYNLHKLLIYNKERPNALMAARKKQVISRFGDLSLLAGICLTYWHFGSSDFSTIFTSDVLISPENHGLMMNTIGLLLVVGALAKSAQFPFHFWLPDTMETPAPVSALMHAGVINAGGFLIIRLSPILQSSVFVHSVLIIVGSVTAVYGALCMVTQNNIKRKLAYSTISQMGMMMFACGIGAYALALFHIIAHSFYKANAFLATGKLIEESDQAGLKLTRVPPAMILCAIGIGFVAIWFGSLYQGGSYLALFTYGSVMFLGLVQNTSTSQGASYNKFNHSLKISGLLILAVSAYVLAEKLLSEFLFNTVPAVSDTGMVLSQNLATVYFGFGLFSLVFWFSAQIMDPRSSVSKAIYLHLWNGGYAGQVSSRLLANIFPKQHSTNVTN